MLVPTIRGLRCPGRHVYLQLVSGPAILLSTTNSRKTALIMPGSAEGVICFKKQQQSCRALLRVLRRDTYHYREGKGDAGSASTTTHSAHHKPSVLHPAAQDQDRQHAAVKAPHALSGKLAGSLSPG